MLKRITGAYRYIYEGIPTKKATSCKMEEAIVFALCMEINGTDPTRRELAELLHRHNDITDKYAIAEYKADFDYALAHIGKGDWNGLQGGDFNDYSDFGRLQRVVIADILGIDNRKLQARGFYYVRQFRHEAYKRMTIRLNGEKI